MCSQGLALLNVQVAMGASMISSEACLLLRLNFDGDLLLQQCHRSDAPARADPSLPRSTGPLPSDASFDSNVGPAPLPTSISGCGGWAATPTVGIQTRLVVEAATGIPCAMPTPPDMHLK